MHTLSQIQLSPSVHDPFSLTFSLTQVPEYDSTFKSAANLLEKAENIRFSLKTSLQTMLLCADCGDFLQSFEAWIYALSALCQGEIAKAGLQIHAQNPYLALSLQLSEGNTRLFFENLKLFLRTALETQQVLSETREKLNEIGHKVASFSENPAKLQLSFLSAALLRRNLQANLGKLSKNAKQLANLQGILKQFAAEKPRFFRNLNEILRKADEIGLRGWYERRFSPRDFRDLLNSQGVRLENAGNCAKLSETGDFQRKCSTFEEFDEFFEENSSFSKLFEENSSFSKQSSRTASSLSANREKFPAFPLIIPYKSLTFAEFPDENACLFGEKVCVKELKLEETASFLQIVQEISDFSAIYHENLARCVGISLRNEPFSTFLLYEAKTWDLCQAISRKTLYFKEKVRISAEILRTLDFLQRNQRVHGNLSTKTVKLNEKLGVSLSEYGFSRVFRAKDVRICSIEHLSNGVYARNHDIYSFGVLFFEIFAEKRAWEGLKDEEIVEEKKKLAFFQGNPRLGKGLDEIIEKCVDCEEFERPSARDLLEIVGKLPAKRE